MQASTLFRDAHFIQASIVVDWVQYATADAHVYTLHRCACIPKNVCRYCLLDMRYRLHDVLTHKVHNVHLANSCLTATGIKTITTRLSSS